jgi:hypothetical protein
LVVYQIQSEIQRHRTSTRCVLDGGSTLDLKGPSTPAVPIHASGKDDVCNNLQTACLVPSLGCVVALTGRIEGGGGPAFAAVVKVQGELSCAGSVHSISWWLSECLESVEACNARPVFMRRDTDAMRERALHRSAPACLVSGSPGMGVCRVYVALSPWCMVVAVRGTTHQALPAPVDKWQRRLPHSADVCKLLLLLLLHRHLP